MDNFYFHDKLYSLFTDIYSVIPLSGGGVVGQCQPRFVLLACIIQC